MKQFSGFTLLELVLVVALTSILAIIGIVSVSRAKQQEDLLTTVAMIAQQIQLAKERSTTGYQDKSWQVELSPSAVTLSDESGMPEFTFQLPSSQRLIAGGVERISFSRPAGLAEDCPSGCALAVERSGGAAGYQFRVLYSGVVEY